MKEDWTYERLAKHSEQTLRIEHFTSAGPREQAWSDRILLDGQPFRYVTSFRAESSIRFAQRAVDLNILIDALTPPGDVPDAVGTVSPNGQRPTPDFRLEFPDRVRYCECTLAGDPHSFTWQLAMGDWQHQLSVALNDDPEMAKRLGERYLAFIPNRPPQAGDIPALVEEIKKLIEVGDLPPRENAYGSKVPNSYERLSKLNTVMASSISSFPSVFVQMPAMTTGGPSESVAQLHSAIRRKARSHYADYRPLWLVVGASEIMWPLDKTIEGLSRNLKRLDPFERIYIATSRESFRLSVA